MRKKSIKAIETDLVNIKFIIPVQYVFIIFLIIFSFAYEIMELDAESLIYPLCFFLLAQTVWTFWSWFVLTKSLFNPYILYFLSATIFNGGQALLEVFNLNKDGILGFLKFTPSSLVLTLFLVVLSLASFHLGALINAANNINNSIKQKSKQPKEDFNLQYKACYYVGLLFLSISFFPTLFVIKNTAEIVQQYGYGGLWDVSDYKTDVVNTGADILSSFIIPASMFLLAGCKYRKNGKIISLSLIIIYTIIKFALGQRNQGIMPLMCFAWLWHTSISPLPQALILGTGTLMVSVVFPVIAMTRNATGEERLSLEYLIESYQNIENPIINSISEMGASMLTVTYTIELVPKVKSFQMGADYLYALLTLLPNFFGGRLHPSIARGIPDVWLVNQVNPEMASYNSTYGFSFIAEAYLNFGWYGSLIALGIQGFFFTKLIIWATSQGHPAKMAMIASFLSFFLFYPRGASIFMVRPLVWYSFIPYFFTYILTKSLGRKS